MRPALGNAALASFAGIVCLFLVLPSLVVVPMSFNDDNLLRIRYWDCRENSNNEISIEADGTSQFTDFNFDGSGIPIPPPATP